MRPAGGGQREPVSGAEARELASQLDHIANRLWCGGYGEDDVEEAGDDSQTITAAADMLRTLAP